MKKIFDTGITLVALVVTIVVLLILAGITIVYVFGENGVLGQASEAKLKTDIANWQERLEMAKSPVFIEGLGTFDPDKYFDYIQGQGIINNKDTDVIDNGDGTYDVTTKPGYVFLVTLMPNSEKPTDAEIEYIGQAGKIAPIIKRLDVSATSNSITGKAVVARIGANGTIKYYYKSTLADDSTYQEITDVSQETGATQSTGITAGESYTIKVVAKNEVGEVALAKKITVTTPTVADIVGETQVSNKTIEDENGNKIVIPGGFRLLPHGTKSDNIDEVIYTYDTNHKPCVQDGIVIADEEDNQFVWIPVGNIKNKDGTITNITLGRYTFDTTNGTPNLKQNATNYSSTVTIDSYYQELTSNSGNTASKSLSTFVSKTNNNGGYYLGRYEASQGIDEKVDTQVYKTPWDSITQPNAATASREMYNSIYVDSDLMNSYSWDTAIVFIQNYSGNNNYANKKSVNTESVVRTGESGDKVCNIHDMASNCYEWNTEHSTRTYSGNSYLYVCRGGDCYYHSTHITASRHNNSGIGIATFSSFRPLLYLK